MNLFNFIRRRKQEKSNKVSDMTQEQIYFDPDEEVGGSTPSTTNEPQPTEGEVKTPERTFRFSAPWMGAARPTEGRVCKVLVYAEPVFGEQRSVAINYWQSTGPEHVKDGQVPEVKLARITRLYPAYRKGEPDFVGLEPVEEYSRDNPRPTEDEEKTVIDQTRRLQKAFAAAAEALTEKDFARYTEIMADIAKTSATLTERTRQL